MMRVVIVGCPGAGKTVFARKLVVKTGLPLVHLDYYYHDKSKNYETDKTAWTKKVESLVAKDRWIMDGNYSSGFPIRFKRADIVIFFDYPRRLVLYRMFKRRLIYQFKRRTDMPAGWREKIPWKFLKFVWNFNKNYRHRITDILYSDDQKNTVVFRSPADADQYLNNFAKIKL
jgi:adenylate kinase family enzyme